MDFDLTDEQSLLKDSVSRWASDRYAALERVEAARRQPLGFDPEAWAELAELGLLGLPFAEGDGGFGGGPVETMLAFEALGRHLAPVPYLAGIVLGGGALRLAGSPAQRAEHVPALAEGRHRFAFAHGERQARYDRADVALAARREGGGYRLDGEKCVVLNADAAQTLVVSARTAGGRREREGISLFLVPADAPGVSVRAYPTHDGGRAADLLLAGVRLPADALLGPADAALPVIERVLDEGIAAVAAEAVGLMDALHGLTLDYLKTRRQFGTAIGAFQVLQHRAVDMLMALEQARSMALYATMMASSEDAAERGPAVSAAKVQINRSARSIGQEAVQLHGGIGMTLEYLGAHQFRRLTAIEHLFGDTPYHLRRVSAAGGLPGAA
ncbi:acyl-CoA dehydrogenase family protein [Methylobacterium nigriterrae]|uniref:acyl-CoA dehydrogenase family protein n=1 Tax=Methylobacterium nigriterrae TaxID=3127512 RepID=UPI0030135F1A